MACILQWNCQSIEKKLPELEQHSNEFDIMAFSETWLFGEEKLLLRNFDTIKWSRDTTRGGGVSILVRKNIVYEVLEVTNKCGKKLEVCGIKIRINNKDLFIVSIYRPPTISISTDEWLSFLNQFNNKNVLILGDYNAHHTHWGSTSSSAEGNRLFEALSESDFDIMNDGSMTTLPSRSRSGSAIDLSLATVNLLPYASWEVINESWGSDHYPIKMEIFGQVTCKNRASSRRLYSGKTCWEKVKNNFHMSTPICRDLAFDCSINPLEKYSRLTAIISKCITDAAPVERSRELESRFNRRGNNTFKSNNIPSIWWNSDCEKAVRLRKAAFLKFKFCSSYENFIEYKKNDARTKIVLRTVKKDHFLEFCSSLDLSANSSCVWAKIKKMSKNYHREEMSNVFNAEAVVAIRKAINLLCPDWVPTGPLNLIEANATLSFNASWGLDEPFSYVEFSAALQGTKNKSSPGIDKIDYVILKSLPIEIKTYLVHILNELFFQNL